MEDELTELLFYDRVPPEKLRKEVEQLAAYEISGLPDEIIYEIAEKLHFYAQLMKDLPEWRKASKLSAAELAAASETLGKAVECIRDNLLRTDDALIYHQEVIESFAWTYKKTKGHYTLLY